MRASLETPFIPADPSESVDVLSDVLRSARPLCVGVQAPMLAAPWAFHSNGNRAAFYCVTEGTCWLTVDSSEPPLSLTRGDIALVMPGTGHVVCDRAECPAGPIPEVSGRELAEAWSSKIFESAGSPTRLLCGFLAFDKIRYGTLLASLPRVVVVPGDDGRPAPRLEEIVRLMVQESDLHEPGRRLMLDHLAQVIFVQALRTGTTGSANGGDRWMAALTDPAIGSALELMHGRLDAPWTVASLAGRVGMSRSAFAARFKTLVQKSPLQYLFECRMQKACDLFSEGRIGIKEVAVRVGYATHAAFRKAFRRWSGVTPGDYRRRIRQQAAAAYDRPGLS